MDSMSNELQWQHNKILDVYAIITHKSCMVSKVAVQDMIYLKRSFGQRCLLEDQLETMFSK